MICNVNKKLSYNARIYFAYSFNIFYLFKVKLDRTEKEIINMLLLTPVSSLTSRMAPAKISSDWQTPKRKNKLIINSTCQAKTTGFANVTLVQKQSTSTMKPVGNFQRPLNAGAQCFSCTTSTYK